MPRLKKPHRFEVLDLPCDPSVPLHLRRALYTRLSDDDLDKISHTSQQHDIQAAFGLTQTLPLPAEERASLNGVAPLGASRGYVVTKIYRDSRTGADPKRIAFKQLIADAHAGKHAGVLFRDDDRLFRGVVGGWPLVQLHEELPNYLFEAARGAFSIDDFAIHAYMSGRERDKTRQRTMGARRLRAANGQAVHTKFPYWIVRDPVTDGGVHVPERADAMRTAIRMYADGTRLGLVARWMTEHAPPGGESTTWSTERLREAFRSTALWGRMDYGRHKIITEKRGDEVFVIGRGINDNAIPFKVEPLLHRTDLERAACSGCAMDDLPSAVGLDELIKSNNQRTGGRPALRPHPLRRRVVCPCGWRMAYSPKWLPGGREQDYGYLYCTRTKQRGLCVVADYPDCATPTLRTRTLWPRVRELVIAAVRQPDRVIAQVEADILAAASAEARTAAEDDAALEKAADALQKLDDAENRLYERWDGNEISRQVYERQTTRIATERLVHEEIMRQVLDRRRILQTAAGATQMLREKLVKAAALPFEALDWQEWTDLFQGLVQDVVIDQMGEPSLRWRRE